MKIHSFPWLLIMLLIIGASNAAYSVTLVREGKPEAVIITAAKPDRAARLAADELAHHLYLISGARVPILTEGEAFSDFPIYLGDTEAARTAGLGRDQFADQEYAVEISDRAIYLVGRDASDKGRAVYDPQNEVYSGLPSYWSEQGTLYATYDFLEKKCGVRWLEATRYGSFIPSSSTLVVEPASARSRPSFSYRDALAGQGDHTAAYDTMVTYWRKESPEALKAWREVAHRDLAKRFPKQVDFERATAQRAQLHMLRMRNGGTPQRGNHSLYGYYARFWDNPETRRPEFFAKGYGEGKPPQLCYTNPELIKQVAADAARYYDTGKSDIFWRPAPPNPFPVVANDNSDFCKCDTCQAWIKGASSNSKTEPSRFFSNGKYSDYFVQFVNEVVRELKKTHPDKSVLTLAYSSYAAPPTRVKLDPSVSLQFCMPANRDDRPPGSFEHEMELLRQWAEDGSNRPLTMWLYNTFPNLMAKGQGIHSWPGVFSHELVRQMRGFHDLGVQGFFHCGLAQEVDQYLTMQTMRDVTQDADTLLNDYFTGLYGAAAGPVREFYRLVEERYRELGSGLVDETSGKKQKRSDPYSKEFVDSLEIQLGKADALAKTEREKGNLELLRNGIWRYITEGMKQRELITSTPIPTFDVPRVADAKGDPNIIDWAKVPALESWYEHGKLSRSSAPLTARVAHDGTNLYLELIDRCDTAKLTSLAKVFPSDCWEIFVSGQRGLPIRHYAFNPEGKVVGYSNGEVNFRMRMPLEDQPMKVWSDAKAPDQWVARVVWPLADIIQGGIAPGQPFYLNIARVASGNRVTILGPLTALRDMKRGPAFNLQ